ncbi:MAG: MBL fold metallo-hydrolase [Thermodesulfobacteriota bacterium]|nr:MBL fold metallo-hydrolase [Thermodesulfobacteriota bacterium]
MNITNLHCIDLDQPALEGFRRFISSWLIQEPMFTALIDPGPLSTIPLLVNALRKKGVDKLDYILLTHIHIDHAGGTGELLKYFPAAQVICHPDGIHHMVSPEKLWQGSKQVLGEMAEAYGEIIPLPADKISYVEHVGNTGIRVYKTPGHAAHHMCFMYDDLLLGGEVCGVHSEIAHGIYMRPATPPRFILNVAIESIDRMIALQPRYMVIGHHGLVEPAIDYLNIGRKQLNLWVQAIAVTANSANDAREQAIFDWLITHDEIFKNIDQLDADIYARERYFMGNSLRGMIGYFDSLTAQQQKKCVSANFSTIVDELATPMERVFVP